MPSPRPFVPILAPLGLAFAACSAGGSGSDVSDGGDATVSPIADATRIVDAARDGSPRSIFSDAPWETGRGGVAGDATRGGADARRDAGPAHVDGGRADGARRDASSDGSGEDAVAVDASIDAGRLEASVREASADGAPGCSSGSTRSCTTSCGSMGSETCQGGAWGGCVPPAEVCNLADDDCDGYCDDILGCRVGVDRSRDPTNGLHFYTTSDSEASCCGYGVETYDYYYLYASPAAGLEPFYRCSSSTGAHLYTTDSTCAGETVEGVMGYIATSAVCGAVPLYWLSDTASGDNFYTTSAAEASSAEATGYQSQGTVGYVWAADCGGPSCTWPSPIAVHGSTTTAAQGFPSTWYGFPIDGAQTLTSISGSVSVTNSADIYSEVLFILQYLPSGTCTAGIWPASTPEFGPPGAAGIANFIVKAPTQGTFTVPVDFTLPGGLPISSCVLLGLNGGTVAASHDVTSAASLSLSFTPPVTPAQSLVGVGGEFCFGQDWGCQGSTTDDSQSFALVTPIASSGHLIALYGDISDSTFDGSGSFGAPPAGAWTATNDFYVCHGSECSAFGVSSGIAGPGDYYASIPGDAVHLLSVPMSGDVIGVAEGQVFQAFSSQPLSAGDCIVTLWGLQGGGAFDDETQVSALLGP